MKTRPLARACLVALVLVGGTACGVPTQSNPDTVGRRDVPFGLTRDERSTTTTAPDGSDASSP